MTPLCALASRAPQRGYAPRPRPMAPLCGRGCPSKILPLAPVLLLRLVRIPMLGLVNHLARRDRRIRGERPRRGRNDQRHRKNRPEDTFDCMWLKCHDSPLGCAVGDLRGEPGEKCEPRHTSRGIEGCIFWTNQCSWPSKKAVL